MAEVELLFRHETFRPGQKQIVSDAWHAIRDGKHLLLNAPTGSGKTDSALSPALTYAIQNNATVFFITPKISQHRIAAETAKAIAKKYECDLKVVDFVGKRNMCLNEEVRNSPEFYHVCNARSKAHKCKWKNNLKPNLVQGANEVNARLAEIANNTKTSTHEEMVAECAKHEFCAYEVASKLSQGARLIIADYYQLIAPGIRESFFKKTCKDLSKAVVIVDEAHNLPQRMRDYLSSSINRQTFSRAIEEAKIVKHPVRRQLKEIADAFEKWTSENRFADSVEDLAREEQQGPLYNRQERLIEDFEEGEKKQNELPVSKRDFIEVLGGEEQATELIKILEDCGQKYLSEQEKQRSSCLRLATFIMIWQAGGENYCRSFARGELECKCLDPSNATAILDSAHSCIAMSGTLLPLEMYRDVIGLKPERTIMKDYFSHFPQENRLNLVVESVTTKYTERTKENYEKIAVILQSVGDAMEGRRTAFFFPSYKIMNAILPLLQFKNLLSQSEEMSAHETSELIAAFKQKPGILCGVMGGSLSEGIDYDKGEIKCACLIGIPLQEMGLEVESLISYYDKKFGKGWDYGYLFPAMNKALQAAGRGLRSDKDKCAILFMDNRYLWPRYRKCMPRDWILRRAQNPAAEVNAFFSDNF